MDSHAGHTSPPTTGSSPSYLDDYVIGSRRERRPAADVYDAVHRHSGVAYRVYILRPRAMQDQALVHRIGCEVDAGRWIQHPAVPLIAPPGETPSRRLYVAVEHRPAPSLRAVVTEGGWLPAHIVVRLAAPVVEALGEAHALGLVHGRLTPDVIGVTHGDPTCGSAGVVLSGLGLASIDHPGEFTSDERPFVSPEQLRGEEPDSRSDVFGLAALLDYALHGEARRDVQATRGVGGRESVLGVLRAARSVDPHERQQSVKVFWEELLAALIAGSSPDERDDGPRAAAGSVLPAPMAPTRRRRRVARVYTWGLAVPVLAALAWSFVHRGVPPYPPQASQASGEVVIGTQHARSTGPNARLVRAMNERLTSDPRVGDLADLTAAKPSRVRAAPGTTPHTAQASTSPSPRVTRDSAAAGVAASALSRVAMPRVAMPRVAMPTFIIIDAKQEAPRVPVRPNEFGDGLTRTRPAAP